VACFTVAPITPHTGEVGGGGRDTGSAEIELV
jgi:hypothetical protein